MNQQLKKNMEYLKANILTVQLHTSRWPHTTNAPPGLKKMLAVNTPPSAGCHTGRTPLLHQHLDLECRMQTQS